jgi:hypothetical protein
VLLDVLYEQVRQSFLVRLQGEEALLGQLGAALGSAKTDSESAIVDLEMFAYRLRGAAAVFGLPEIRVAAKALELAAAAAAVRSASIGDPPVLEAINLLAMRLTCLNGFTQGLNPLVTPTPAN